MLFQGEWLPTFHRWRRVSLFSVLRASPDESIDEKTIEKKKRFTNFANPDW